MPIEPPNHTRVLPFRREPRCSEKWQQTLGSVAPTMRGCEPGEQAVLTTDVTIIGAGAAGLMCAAQAGARGRQVLLLDHANKAGKKILMSGGGRCNFTNMYSEPGNFLSHNPHFCKSALARYTQWDFIELVARHGVHYHEKKLGQLFCDNTSSDILELLLAECDQPGVELRLDTRIEQIDKTERGYRLRTSAGQFDCQSLV